VSSKEARQRADFGGRAGARRGLLIRGGDILEAASHVDTVVFDKTGTLTAGRPSVARVSAAAAGTSALEGGASAAAGRARGGLSAAELLAFAAAVERHANHPIACAIVAAADAAPGAAARPNHAKKKVLTGKAGTGISLRMGTWAHPQRTKKV
jgi:P-type Cu+ transporter